jgi:DNA repair protein RecN (Recombination protein N)
VLLELRIRDFAVIESAVLECGRGLNVLTGETGAGKSMIVDALAAALGARWTTEVIRAGAERSVVEARFELDPAGAAAAWLRAGGFEDDGLVVARDIATTGRSRGWINGRPVTAGMLRELGDRLVEIAGQHEGQRLLRASSHLDLLDAFGGPALGALRAQVAGLVARRQALRAERQALIDGERERAREIDTLLHQVHEIDAARLHPGEDADLRARRARLANASRLAAAAQGAYAALYEAEGQAAIDQVGRARGALREVAAIDGTLEAIAGRLESAAAVIAEAAHDLSRYAAAVEDRPDELEAVEERLALMRSLERKYGDGLEAIAAYRDRAVAALERLQGSDARIEAIAGELASLERDLAARCEALGALRRKAAARLEVEVRRTLGALEMQRTRFTVAFDTPEDPDGLPIGDRRVGVTATGVDRVEFLLAPNPGEPPRPLARIASGGELSRVMLALRHALADAEAVPVLVCDEIDAGVGSRTAGAVGRVLADVSKSRQVLCVTHLPQIASLADQHFWIEKETGGARTRVRVRRLDAHERVEEVARMLGGRRPSAIAAQHARELLGARSPSAKHGRGGKP